MLDYGISKHIALEVLYSPILYGLAAGMHDRLISRPYLITTGIR